MQLKEYFEKFEINPKLWAKRHGWDPDNFSRYLTGKLFPSSPTREFISKATGGHVTELDWLELRFLGPDACKARASDKLDVASEKQCTPQAEADDNLVAALREDEETAPCA